MRLHQFRVVPGQVVGECRSREAGCGRSAFHNDTGKSPLPLLGSDGDQVMVHGTSGRTLARTRGLWLMVVEATCPLVRVARDAVFQSVAHGKRAGGLKAYVLTKGPC